MKVKDIANQHELDSGKFETFLFSSPKYRDVVKYGVLNSILPDEYADAAVADFCESEDYRTDDEIGLGSQFQDESTYSFASGRDLPYVVLQVTLKEKLIGTGSDNLTELEDIINAQASRGYRLHSFSTTSAHSTGLAGGDRIQATMVFEKIV